MKNMITTSVAVLLIDLNNDVGRKTELMKLSTYMYLNLVSYVFERKCLVANISTCTLS